MRDFVEMVFAVVLSAVGTLFVLVLVGLFIAVPLAMVLWVLRWFSLI